MTESPSGIPHALETAFCNLVAALDDGIRQYQANLQYTNSHDVCRCIERFVDALRHISGGQAELQKRAALVETRCGPGSQYATARAQSLKYRGQPQKLSASQQAISQLRRSSGSPRSLAEVETERRYVEYVLDDPKRKLSPPVREGFAALHNACRAVEREGIALQVDGCRHLYLVHHAAEPNPSEEATYARLFMQAGAGANLESIKMAAESLVAWVGETNKGNTADHGDEVEPSMPCHVTLSQMAAIVNKSKPTLERLKYHGKLPAPAVKGGKGKADEWRWSDVRPVLEAEYRRQLPEIFPGDRFVRR